MRAVNLLPREEVVRSFAAKRGVAFGAAGGFALVTVAISALLLGASGAVGERQEKLDSLNAELAAVPKPEDRADAGAEAQFGAEKNARVQALSTALAGRIAWDGVLRQISQVLPEDVWLTSLATNPATDGGGAAMTLVGSTYSQSGVARLLSRLAVVPALSSVSLQNSSSARVGGQRLVQFTITAHVKGSGGAA